MSFLAVLDPDLREPLAVLVEVADLDERRPEFERPLDVTDHVVDDPQQVLLEEVGLEAVIRLLQVGGEQAATAGAGR